VSANMNDEMVKGPLVTYRGEVVNQPTKTALEGVK
jgi:hypothetical protein